MKLFLWRGNSSYIHLCYSETNQNIIPSAYIPEDPRKNAAPNDPRRASDKAVTDHSDKQKQSGMHTVRILRKISVLQGIDLSTLKSGPNVLFKIIFENL